MSDKYTVPQALLDNPVNMSVDTLWLLYKIYIYTHNIKAINVAGS